MSADTILKITDVDNIDLDEYCLLHKTAFKELLTVQKVKDGFLTPDFFKWKYNTPAGKAKIAIIQKEERIIAGVAVWPLSAIYNGKVITVWHSGDVVALPGERGKWFFAKCMKALMSELPEGSFLFGFPNQNNAAGANRAGFKPIEQLNFYAKVYTGFYGKKYADTLKNFTQPQDQYAKDVIGENTIGIYRSAAYMNWRYLHKPETDYHCYNVESDGKIIGNTVVRSAIIKGKRILLVMEYHYTQKNTRHQLLKFIKQAAAKEKCSIIGIFSGKLFAPEFFNTGFIKVPDAFLPKKQILVGTLNNANEKTLLQNNWLIQTGDWDAF